MKKYLVIVLFIVSSLPLFTEDEDVGTSAVVEATATIINQINFDTTNAELDFGTIFIGNSSVIDLTNGTLGTLILRGSWKNSQDNTSSYDSSINPSNSNVKLLYPKNIQLTGEDGGVVVVELDGW